MTALDLAQRWALDVKELPGAAHHPAIMWAHRLCKLGTATPDEVAWCSSILNLIAWTLQLPMSYSAAARSWLDVGTPITLDQAVPGNDVVILRRGTNPAQGHVALFVSRAGDRVSLCGGNQGNRMSVATFPVADVIGVRRLA